MATFKKNQGGFTLIETIMAIVIIALIGAAGWLVYKNHSKTNAEVKTSKTIKTDANGQVVSGASGPNQSQQYSGWQSFCSSYGGLCLRYPSSWRLSQASHTPGQSASGQEVDTIVGPSGGVAVVYMPGAQVSGDRRQETISVAGTTKTEITGLEVVKLIDQLSSTQYAVEYYVTLNSAAHALNKQDSPFTTGSTIANSSEPPYHQFTNSARPDNIGQQLLAVTGGSGDPAGNLFSSSAAAQAWLSNADVVTAGQILASVTFSQ